MRFTTSLVMTILSGALIAQGGSLSSQTGAQTNEAQKLFQEMKANASQIDSCARQIEKLARTSNASWSDYDQQWNRIKPAQERLSFEQQRLERMQASLSPGEQQALAPMKRDVAVVAGRTHDLWLRISEPAPGMKTRVLNADARSLDKAARDLIKETASKS